MSDYKKVVVKTFPRLTNQDNRETKFWEKFQPPVIAKEFAAVTCVDFSQAEPHDFAVTSGSRVQIYSSANNQVKKSIARFGETAHSARFRHDGRLLVAGGEEGVVKVFDLGSRAVLRNFKGHSKAVKSVSFLPSGLRVVSGSDDTSLRVWDMATESCLVHLSGHEDYLRAVAVIPASPDLIVSGSYDHSVTLWDLRSQRSVLRLDHEAPVEDILVFPSGGVCLSAGSNYVKVWDLLGGGKLLTAFSNHQKTITSLSFDGLCERLFSASLDRQVKVYRTEDYQVVHTLSYPAPLLSVAMSPSNSHVVAGMTTRLVSIRQMCKSSQSSPTHPFSLPPPSSLPGTYRYFVRGRSYKPTMDEHVVSLSHKSVLKDYDKHLRKFRYRKALDAALLHDRRARNREALIFSVLQELAHRDGLEVAISGRNEEEMVPLLKYLIRNVTNPKYSPLLVDVCGMVLEVYGREVGRSQLLQKMLLAMKHRVEQEVQFLLQAHQLLGVMDTILAISSSARSSSGSRKLALFPHKSQVCNSTSNSEHLLCT